MQVTGIETNKITQFSQQSKIREVSQRKKPPSFGALIPKSQIAKYEQFMRANLPQHPNMTEADIYRILESLDGFNALYEGMRNVNPQTISNELYKKFNIHSDFQGDKILAGCCALVANIFHKLQMPQPPSIVKAPLDNRILGCCNAKTRDLTFNASFNWASIQEHAIKSKVSNFNSSGHFLATFLHEFMHNFHVAKLQEIVMNDRVKNFHHIFRSDLFKKLIHFNQDLETIFIKQNSTEITNPQIKSYIDQKVSTYGSTLPAEMFAEKGTQMIADVLDKRSLRPTRNPFMFKELDQDKFLMEMMNDFYAGNFRKYLM